MLKLLLFAAVPAMLLGAERTPIGLTAQGRSIDALVEEADRGDLPEVILIAGLDGDAESSRVIRREAERYEESAKMRRAFRLIVIPMANPAQAAVAFPPAGVAYRENTESHYLWRWLMTQAPDLVLVSGEDAGLVDALASLKIPARRVHSKNALAAVPKTLPKSAAKIELERRLARSPEQVARELAKIYGHDFSDAVYIPAMALIARLRLGEAADVLKLAEPFIDGTKDSLTKPSASHTAGHLLFAELADSTGDTRYIARVRAAADMATSMHNEMSDSVFMALPILAKAGNLAHEPKYFDSAVMHLRFMQKLCLRPDGLYRHSPLNEAAWGRGNGFPALGLALALSGFPADHPLYEDLVRDFQNHMAALARHQDASGMWHQVVDVAGSYRELSATAMIAAAMTRGIAQGWLDAKSYRPRVERAWRAVSARTGSDGTLVDVCESTGKQKSLDDYLRRAAILGRDARGGGMVMFFATELMRPGRD